MFQRERHAGGFVVIVLLLLLAGILLWWWWRRQWQDDVPSPHTVLPVRVVAGIGEPPSTGRDSRISDLNAVPWGLASIAGTVFASDLRPVGGAQVCASPLNSQMPAREAWRPHCVLSTADGHYHIEGLLPMRHRVTASAAGSMPGIAVRGAGSGRVESFDLHPNMHLSGVDIHLEDGGAELHGIVGDLSGGVIEGARVIAKRSFATSDAEGAFSMWVRPGTQSLVAIAEGYAPSIAEGLAPGHMFRIFLTPESVLVGRVVRAGSEEPVAGATVKAGGQGGAGNHSVITDGSGHFRIEGLEPGIYKPFAKSTNSAGKAIEQTVLGLGETSSPVSIEVYPAFSVDGRLVTEDGDGCMNGWVTLLDPSSGFFASGSAERDGVVHMEGVFPGRYEVNVGCENFISEEDYEPLSITTSSVTGVRWGVSRGLSVQGVIVDAQGRNVAYVEVGAGLEAPAKGSPKGLVNGHSVTDPEGHFYIGGLVPGLYKLSLGGKPFAGSPQQVDLRADVDVDDLRIELADKGSIRGHVHDSDGRPVSRVRVLLKGEGLVVIALVRDNGEFVRNDIPEGPYQIIVEGSWGAIPLDGEEEGGRTIDVRPGHEETIELRLDGEFGEIRGTVLMSSGEPVSDAFIEAYRESADGLAASSSRHWGSPFEIPLMTDADGEFVLRQLLPGKYTLRAYRKGGGLAILRGVFLGTSDARLTIEDTGRLSGSITAFEGSLPEEFSLHLTDETRGYSRRDSFFRTSGHWSFAEIPAGHYKIRVRGGGLAGESEISVHAGEELEGIIVNLSKEAS
ncbi:MAG TPA: carboxypeptidase regulatory-like domain-containing protein [Nannocystis exedens]|nr:carboxypeptidase regulatory-like domain-containing protein [Nannocystis exedens]